jgi:hypothetical protein
MLKIIRRNITPPGGFRDICPDTNFPFVADNLEQLVEKERLHLIANKKEVPANLADQIENRLCQMMPPGICSDGTKRTLYTGASRRPAEGLVNATMKLKNGKNLVSQSEADNRAEICSSCNHNARHHGCGTCRGIHRTINNLLNGRSTPRDHKLQVCDILGVYLKVLVHLKDPGVSLLGKVEAGSKCWLNKKE